MKELILGGVRSGKSALAQQRAIDSGKQIILIATASADDEEMAARISRHQADRPVDWPVVEEPLLLAEVIAANATTDHLILVDCLTLWLSNLLLQQDSMLEQQIDSLIDLVKQPALDVVFVSNETNMGVVPMGELSRRFCDEAGRLHQRLAQHCDRVTLVIAGLEQKLKG